MKDGPIIEHDPDEVQDTTGNRPYWAGAAAVVIVAGGYFLTREPDWHALAVGFTAGAVLMAAMIEYTGNKVPGWMRRL